MKLFIQFKNNKGLLLSLVEITLFLIVTFFISRHFIKTQPIFTAVSAKGPWTFQDEPKDLNLVYMGYSRCPGLGPTTLSLTSRVFSKLTAPEIAKLRFLFVDVDYIHDSAKFAQDYAKHFDSSFVGLSGTQAQIDQIVSFMDAKYVVEVEPRSREFDSITHTNKIFFLNRDGVIVETLPNPDSEETLLKLIRKNI